VISEVAAPSTDWIAAYKRILQDVLNRRPSGMRQRLAEALGKNRSFITQISNPAYQTPIPVQHLHRIIEICHFSAQERDQLLTLIIKHIHAACSCCRSAKKIGGSQSRCRTSVVTARTAGSTPY
jgi:hypothetical protein